MRASIAVIAMGLCTNAMATTIVAIWTPGKIVITGDSLINSNWTGENGEPRHRTSKDCKIRKFGANYISAAGNYKIQTAQFDLWETASKACGSSIDVDTCAIKFRANLRSILGRAAGVHDVHLSVLVAGLQNGAPALEHITFIGQPDGRLSVRSESFRRGRQKWGRVILGLREAIDHYERTAPSTRTRTLEEQALSLVRIEARAQPQEVGPPFSTLAIEASGGHWTNPGCCPASCPK